MLLDELNASSRQQRRHPHSKSAIRRSDWPDSQPVVEHVSEVRLRIGAVQARCSDERVDRSGALGSVVERTNR